MYQAMLIDGNPCPTHELCHSMHAFGCTGNTARVNCHTGPYPGASDTVIGCKYLVPAPESPSKGVTDTTRGRA